MSDPVHASRELSGQSLSDELDPEKIQEIYTDISKHAPPADAQELDEILEAMKSSEQTLVGSPKFQVDSDPEDLADVSQNLPPADDQELKEILEAMACSRQAKKPKRA